MARIGAQGAAPSVRGQVNLNVAPWPATESTQARPPREALATAFCLSTDASGIAVQPDPKPDKSRQASRRGHYFVQIADRDHVFFEYTPRETSAAVGEMFRGFTSYVQSDAKNAFDILFRPPPLPPDPDDPHDGCVRKQVGCWTHNRRGFWEVAVTTKHPVAREAVYRIGRIYELEEAWKNKTPEEIGQFRKLYMRPHMDSFFAWAKVEFEKVKSLRMVAFGLTTTIPSRPSNRWP